MLLFICDSFEAMVQRCVDCCRHGSAEFFWICGSTAHEKLRTWTDTDPVPSISFARILSLITANWHQNMITGCCRSKIIQSHYLQLQWNAGSPGASYSSEFAIQVGTMRIGDIRWGQGRTADPRLHIVIIHEKVVKIRGLTQTQNLSIRTSLLWPDGS